jgi:Transposase
MERRKFTREFKLEAVRLIKDRGVSYVQASQDLGVLYAARIAFAENVAWGNNLRSYSFKFTAWMPGTTRTLKCPICARPSGSASL